MSNRTQPRGLGLGSVFAAVCLLTAGCHHLRPEAEPAWPDGTTRHGAGPANAATAPSPWTGYATGPATIAAPAVAPTTPYPSAAPGAVPAGPTAAPRGGSSHGSPLGHRAVAYARGQLGKPYCYGGVGPGCFDCSGLTYAAWRWAGRPVPRTSSAQQAELTAIPWAAGRAGDIAWRPGHVGLYVGHGWVIHAPETGKRVEYEPANEYRHLVRP
jgi:cell wall-associated NlpC family hydrolase